MKSFSTVYNKSKQEVLEANQAMINRQKGMVLEKLKTEYMITGKLLDLPNRQQQKLAKILLEYWKPKTGLTEAGKKYLETDILALNENSSKADITKYIKHETKKNIDNIVESFLRGKGKLVVEAFKRNIEPQIKKSLSGESVKDVVWGVISERMKNL